jgi:hypothetical protein
MKVCLCLLLAACAPAYTTTATKTFTSTYSCPAERQTITREAPPADIAKDPERAAVWNDEHHIFDVSGCGHTAAFECYVSGGEATNPWVDCMQTSSALRAFLNGG